MGVPRKRRGAWGGDGVLPVTAAVVAVAVLALLVVPAVMGLPTETVIALSSAAVLTAAELVRRLVSAVSSGRRRR
ncbi:hypothetical protein [Kitasatospora sp. NPDC093558]|uniref:hypothetical protein n=1 Tax=Kitasatospora sp. NPDC093558 TaxID=3155201 RepID=UPI0034458B5E